MVQPTQVCSTQTFRDREESRNDSACRKVCIRVDSIKVRDAYLQQRKSIPVKESQCRSIQGKFSH